MKAEFLGRLQLYLSPGMVWRSVVTFGVAAELPGCRRCRCIPAGRLVAFPQPVVRDGGFPSFSGGLLCSIGQPRASPASGPSADSLWGSKTRLPGADLRR